VVRNVIGEGPRRHIAMCRLACLHQEGGVEVDGTTAGLSANHRQAGFRFRARLQAATGTCAEGHEGGPDAKSCAMWLRSFKQLVGRQAGSGDVSAAAALRCLQCGTSSLRYPFYKLLAAAGSAIVRHQLRLLWQC
jgi:hypothetical protein